MMDIHYWPTPNGKKVTIQLEECSVEYTVVPCAIGKGDQFEPGFLEICPNNRMPAIVDHEPTNGSDPISVFESGACMMYIAEKTGQFGGRNDREKWEAYQWVMWQMANQGPKTGEYGNFKRADESKVGDQSYGKRRFGDELHRLYGVMNNRLYDRRYLAGDEYTIADMACYPWTAMWEGHDIDIDDFKYFKRWFDELSDRPGVQRGMAVGSDLTQDYSQMTEEELARAQALLFNQRARPAPETGGIE